MYKVLLFLCSLQFFAITAFAQLKVSKLVSDHAVLQRNLEIPIWGTATPNQEVVVNLNLIDHKTTADANGKWTLRLPKMKAGGPHNMAIRSGDEKIAIRDIYIGDVWLCSGQSNMEWTVQNSNNAAFEIAKAKDPLIRHFKVPLTYHFVPQDTLIGGNWEVCNSSTVADFSAVAYYFAKEIRKHQDIPIGLLNSSWGGSRIEPWMRSEVLGYENAEESGSQIKAYMDSVRMATESRLKAVLGDLPKEDRGMKGDVPFWASPDYNHNNWKTIKVPGMWEQQGYADLDGTVWYRKEIYLTKAETQNDIPIFLGAIDDADITYFNGTQIGSTNAYDAERAYSIPKALLKTGKNLITVKVFDSGWGGGFHSDSTKIYYETSKGSQTLCGDWHINVGNVILNNTAMPNQFHTLLYNQMIHPIIQFPIKGALWYQGESNAGMEDAKVYRDQFTTMIKDWRQLWNIGDFPFLWVQLANWQAVELQPTDTGWARLREAQNKTLAVENTAQAVIIDIGETNDIHPRNKQDVGYRLSLGARHLAYNETLNYRGPVYQTMKVDSNKIRLVFDTNKVPMVARGEDETLKEFAIAGADQKFYWAKAKIEGNQIIVWSDKVPNPVAVRYAWSNNPIDANLYSQDGIPASPFRTDGW